MAYQEVNKYLLVAAIDFGTTYSGYAFSTRQTFSNDQLNIVANQVWNAGTKQLLSLKTPTCILLKKNKEFVSFGYMAENEYAEIVSNQEEEDYYFFQQFKMMLYNTKNLSLESELEDVRGQAMFAVDVFAAGIKALRDHLHGELANRSIDIGHDEIKWVLTVPAIWSDRAKQFMRESAKRAGIKDQHLLISLEPENASIFCQFLQPENIQGNQAGFSNIQKGTKYMVVDIGGGTVDITAHEKVGENQIVELCKATGSDCGGIYVDKEFLEIFDNIIGRELMDRISREDVETRLDLTRAFETTKRNIHSFSRPKVNITFPFVSINTFCTKYLKKDFSTLLLNSEYSGNIKLNKDKLVWDLELLKSLFKKTIDNIIGLIRKVLSNGRTKEVTTLLLVGGFSECHLVQKAIKNTFTNKTIITPEEPSLAVLKGAVLFGHMPNLIQARCLRRTYGRRIKPVFDSSVHDDSRKVLVDDTYRCKDIFEPFITVNESIPIGKKVTVEYHTVQKKQNKVTVAIYATEEENFPKYVDDEKFEKLGEFVVHIPDPTDERRYVLVQLTFGETELRAKAVEKSSKKKFQATLKLL